MRKFIILYKGKASAVVPFSTIEEAQISINERLITHLTDRNDYEVAELLPMRRITKTITTWEPINA